MSTAAVRTIVAPETAEQDRSVAAAPGSKLSKATTNNYSAQAEAQRRKWGTETKAVRSTHARKF
jgi:hypothetical protein